MGNAPEWRAIGQSVRGASHVRSGLPNQDAICWMPESGNGPPLIVAVSDGHGSPKSFRSDVGARFAVEQTVALLKTLLEGHADALKLSTIKRTAEERLPQEVVRRWQQSVDTHLKGKPFTEEELEAVEAKQGASARRTVEKNPYLAYGATILSVLVTDAFILYVQLGDGDILTVMDDDDVNRPVPGDERLFANQTTSLCTKDAWRDVRLRFQTLYGPRPALILLSSDGYANSFVNDQAFLKVGTDILDIMRTDGAEVVEQNLKAWLSDASQAGSGDDITLGLIYRADVPGSEKLAAPPSAPPKPAGNASTAIVHIGTPDKDMDEQTEGKGEHTTTEASAGGPTPKVVDSAQPEIVKPDSSVTAREEPSQPTGQSGTEEGGKKRKRRIKDDPGPHEPSKKLPDLYYED